MSLSKRLRSARVRAGYDNAAVFADSLRVRPNTVYRIERGEQSPSVETLARWAELCGVTTDSLLLSKPRKRSVA
jgi:transcriptional regulator with XRE-family HTH domain